MKVGFIDGVFCGVLAALIFGVVAAFAAPQPTVQAVKVSHQDDCCVRLGYLKSSIVTAFNESMRGNHKEAQEIALDGLRRAGFSCTTITDPTEPRGKFLCE